MAAEPASDWVDEQTVAAMAADPATQDMIYALHEEVSNRLSAIIDNTAALLLQKDAGQAPDNPMGAPLAMSKLGAESTRRRQAWEAARKHAEMLVIGALINKDNPAWDPADASTCVEEGQGTLLSLLRFDPAV